MLKIENKISGWKVTGCENIELLFDSQVVSLQQCIDKITSQKAMDYVLDTLRFTKGRLQGMWLCVMDYDLIYKLTILEKYPEYAKELTEHFGENWLSIYLRFGH